MHRTNSHGESPVIRDVATVTVSEAVDGTVKRRRSGSRRMLASRVEHVVVDPRVMAAAKGVQREGESILILSESEVWLAPTASKR